MTQTAAPPTPRSLAPRIPEAAWVAGLIVLMLVLAWHSLLGDSITFDEMSHLTAGASYLSTGDYRLAPEHPPLAKIWAALPAVLMQSRSAGPGLRGWSVGNQWEVGAIWFYDHAPGERMLTAARTLMLAFLVATALCIWWCARTLFGTGAGRLALAIAAVCPTLLAHGRLVTTDMPMTACNLLVLVALARLLERVTPLRVFAVAAALAAASLAKFSWFLILPPAALMALVRVVRPAGFGLAWRVGPKGAAPAVALGRPTAALAALASVGVLVVLFGWVAIWSCYGWRYSPFRGDDAHVAMMDVRPDYGQPLPRNMTEAWEVILHTPDGKVMRGILPEFIRFARPLKLLPEAYLYGLAYTLKTTLARSAYLMGEFSTTGFADYFPIAFTLKTPIAAFVLILAGLAALLTQRARLGSTPWLAVGVFGFTLIYAASAFTSKINIGHRHILPLYPGLYVCAGAAALWWNTRVGKVLICAALLWLVFAVGRTHPHYLSYFNELVGGPANGYLYLADSNVDWGQDHKRLAAWARAHPGAEPIKLAQFSSGDPTRYGFACEALPSYYPFEPRAALTGGTYAVAVTMLLGVYKPEARDDFWANPRFRYGYRMLAQIADSPEPPAGSAEHQRWQQARTEYDDMRRSRLLWALRRRPPDDRVGWSLMVYRLSDAEVERLTAPPPE